MFVLYVLDVYLPTLPIYDSLYRVIYNLIKQIYYLDSYVIIILNYL